LLSRLGGYGSTRRLTIVTHLVATVIAPDDLAVGRPLAGWTLLTCGLRISATDASLRPITYFRRGIKVCFYLPVGWPAFSYLRVGYYAPALERWVMLRTTVTDGMACTAPFRLPTDLAVFGYLPQ